MTCGNEAKTSSASKIPNGKGLNHLLNGFSVSLCTRRLKLAAAGNARSADCPNPQRVEGREVAGMISMLVCPAMCCELGQLALRLTLARPNLTLSVGI